MARLNSGVSQATHMVDSPEIIQADLHKSIGGFIAEYSRFHGLLEYSAIYILSDGGKLDVADNASILISGLTTQALSKAIFSMIINARGGAWEDNEIDLIKKCRNEIDTLVATRNRTVHDIWTSIPRPDSKTNDPVWSRARRSHSPSNDDAFEQILVTSSDLEELTRSAARLSHIIQVLAVYSRNQYKPNLRSALYLMDGPNGKKVASIVPG